PGQGVVHDIGVALDDDEAFGLRDRPLREVEAVEDLCRAVERGLRGVEVLRALVVVVQTPGPESDGPCRHVLDRPDHAAAESVVDAASALTGQACGQYLLIGESGAPQMRGQRVPGLRGEADAEFP